ncbi:MAG: carboxypeptidase regulatory-like domain-containing protein, partial [Gemmatimonadetes bacterium]|nr:carboxypeptidase regulatory-like domain-containing protein [Gemmatimonadota bacterium]
MQLRVAGRFIRRVVLAGLLLAVASAARAGTTGTIAGVVLDDKGSPVAVATVRVEDQRFGAYTNDAGEFTILNVPPGTYSLRVTRIGYESVVVRDLVVSADETTRAEVRANPTLIESAEVVVVAERLPVDLKITSGRVSVTEKEIEMLPIQDLQDVVDLQAGVVDGHFRGGRIGEVQYQVDGVSVNDPFNNTAIVSVDRSLLKEAQVISGTFDAEYGQAMSGVVNAVLKSGTEQFDGNVEIYGGDFAYGESADRIVTHSFDPLGTQSYQASLSGPLGLPHTVFLASGRYFRFDDYVDAERRFVPTDRADFEAREFFPTGDGAREAL